MQQILNASQSYDRVRFISEPDSNPLNASFVDEQKIQEKQGRVDFQAASTNDTVVSKSNEKARWSDFRLMGFSIKNAALLFTGLWSVVSAGIFGMRTTAEHRLRPEAEVRMKVDTADSPWAANSTIFASTTQNELAYFYNSYSHQLASKIKNSSTLSLWEAQRTLEENGLSGIYRMGPQLPVSTPRPHTSWVKSELKNRKAIFLTGTGEAGPTRNFLSFGDERRFLNQVDVLSSALAAEYNLQDADISKLHTPKIKAIEREFEVTSSRIGSEDEIFIYIAAHGDRTEGQGTGQGSHNGILAFSENESMTEQELKQFVQKYFGHASNVTIIIDACYSGSFIS